MTEKYLDSIIENIEVISKEKSIETLKDYLEVVSRGLTEVEKDILEILELSQDAITINKIRNVFTTSQLFAIGSFIIEKDKEGKAFLSNDGILFKDQIRHACENVIKTKYDILIDYPKSYRISPLKAREIIKEIFDLPSKEDDASIKKYFANKITTSLRETETDYMERVRRVLSKYGFAIPSVDVIKPSLEFLKEKGLVENRIQNNNSLWYLSPKYVILIKKIERLREEQEKEKSSKTLN